MSRVDVIRSQYPVVVVGAGIAGLTAAFRLSRAGADVRIFEASSRAGGTVASSRRDGHLFEHGPTTVMSTAEHLSALIDDLGLRSRAVLSADMAGRRLVWRHGRLHALPEKPPQLLTCSALSRLGRARLLLEPLIPAKRDREPETLESFGKRRLGKEATAGLLDPFVSGVHAGRLDRLGVDAFPRLALWERAHGSLFRAALEQRREKKRLAQLEGQEPRKGPAPLISFPEGLEELPRALAEKLGSQLSCDRKVTSMGRVGSHWRVSLESKDGTTETMLAAAVIIATPASTAADFLEPWVGSEMGFFRALDHPHVATVGLGFRRQEVGHPLNAFGLLCAGDSRLVDDVLGVLFVSSIFPGRCPEGEVTLTTMVGGSRDPYAAKDDDSALVARVRSALKTLVQAEGEPTAELVTRWRRAIPQYPPGHGVEVDRLRSRLGRLMGLHVAGNWLDGVGLEAAVASADRAARETLAAEWTVTAG